MHYLIEPSRWIPKVPWLLGARARRCPWQRSRFGRLALVASRQFQRSLTGFRHNFALRADRVSWLRSSAICWIWAAAVRTPRERGVAHGKRGPLHLLRTGRLFVATRLSAPSRNL